MDNDENNPVQPDETDPVSEVSDDLSESALSESESDPSGYDTRSLVSHISENFHLPVDSLLVASVLGHIFDKPLSLKNRDVEKNENE